MAMRTLPLREEHKELFPQVELLRTLGDAVGDVPLETLRRDVDRAYEFLAHHLIPHAQAEDRALYPIVAKAMGASEATATMQRDHVEIGRLVGELATLRAQLATESLDAVRAKALRRVLYGLYALVRVHFAKEEEVYLPLLDARLSADEARQMFRAMEQAAREAQAHHAPR